MLMEPRGVFVGEKVRLPNWYDPPERMVDEPIVEEISTEHRAFSTHTVAKVSWSVAKLQGEGVIRQSRLFRVEDLRSTRTRSSAFRETKLSWSIARMPVGLVFAE